MHFVGARFTDLRTASTALGAIRAHVAVAPGDLAVRPLGSTRYDVPTADIVLAGRFEPEDVEAVVGILEAHGGAILARRPESLAVHESAPPPDTTRDDRLRTAERVRPEAPTPHKRLRRPTLRRPTTHLRGQTARDRRIRS